MFNFNQKGHLTPPTIIPSTVSQLELEFVKNILSQTTAKIFGNYVNYSSALKAVRRNV